MMNKIRTGKWADELATKEEFRKAVEEITDTVIRNNWSDKNVYPYGHKENIMKFIQSWDVDGYQKYSVSSKQIMIKEVNGLIDILNNWMDMKEYKITYIMYPDKEIEMTISARTEEDAIILAKAFMQDTFRIEEIG